MKTTRMKSPLTRRQALKTLSTALAAMALAAMHAAEAEPAPRPNIIFLLTDDQRYDDLGAAGNPVICTPHLNRLATEGVFFRNAFVTSSVCMASRATMFTGMVERRHACNFYYRELPRQLWEQSYPVLLRAAGYRSGFIGKYGVMVAGYAHVTPVSDFDYWRGYQGQGNYFPEGPEGPHLTSIKADQAIEFVRESVAEGQPFHLSISFFAPHDPMQPDPALADWYRDTVPPMPAHVSFEELAGLPPAYGEAAWYPRMHWLRNMRDTARRNGYILQRYRLISGMDLAIGRLIEELEAQGVLQNTVIIFTSDNGFYYGERGLSTKFYMHDESLRVPLIIYDPRLPDTKRGRTVEDLVSSIDIAPTILDVAGLSAPEGVQGMSLLPLMRGEPVAWRDAIFAENIIKERRPMCDAIRTERWKYIALFETDPMQEELYDLENDPLETQNLAQTPEYSGVLKDLRERLKVFRVELSGDPAGFPELIRTQRENEANWQNYRRQYFELIGSP